MSLKKDLAAKSAMIGLHETANPKDTSQDTRLPKTAPGQLLAAIPMLAEHEQQMGEKDRQIEALERRLSEATASGQVTEVSLTDLHEFEGLRRKLTPEQYSELKENLKNNRLVQPITVRKRQEGGYEIVSGYNRTAIYRELKREKIAVSILQDADDYLAEASSLYANLYQSELSDYEKFVCFSRLMKISGKSLSDIAKESGCDDSSVSRWMSFSSLPDAALKVIAANPSRIGGAAAAKLAQLCKQGKDVAVCKAVEAIIEGKVSQEAGVAMAASSGSEKRSTPVRERIDIKQGRKIFCSIIKTEKSIRLDFKNEQDVAGLEDEIKKLLYSKVSE